MGKLKRLKCSVPRQTRWSRKNKKKRRELSQPQSNLSDKNSDSSLVDFDQLSITGNVLLEEEWELSSISSAECEERILFSEEESSGDSYDSFDSAEEDPNMSNIPLHPEISISLAESVHLVFAFSRKANLSREALEDLLNLIKLHLPRTVSYPSTSFRFNKQLQVPPVEYTQHIYCSEYHLVQNGFCVECNKPVDEKLATKRGDFFLVHDIRSQLQNLLGNNNIMEQLSLNIQKRNEMRREEIENHYGETYIEVCNSWDLTATINTDGAQVFKSSKHALWPVLIALDELPYLVRKSTILLAALWSGPRKLNVDLVFSRLVPLLNDLQVKGVVWKRPDGTSCESKLFVQKFCADAVARCLVQGITQFNGAYGCGQCKDKGVVVPKGRGRCRVYKQINNLSMRTDDEHRALALSARFQFGIKTATPLLELRNFNMIDGNLIEPMHNVFLGVTKMVFNLWFTLKNSDCYLGTTAKVKTINERLSTCKVPSEIVRTVRNLDMRNHWKASEYRTMLFVMSAITVDLLPKAYHRHLCKLANAIYVLSLPVLTVDKVILAQKWLKTFVKDVSNLYGEEYMSFNVHSLLHLHQCCKNWGPLWQFSAFMFESFNAVLVRYVKNANSVAMQVSRKCSYEMQTRYSAEKLFVNEKAKEMFGTLARVPKKPPTLYYIKLPFKVCNTNDNISYQCSLIAYPRIIYSAKSAVLNGFTFKARETLKRADCYVKVSDNQLGLIKTFLHIDCICENATTCNCQKDLAVLEVFKVTKCAYSEFVFQCSASVRRQEIVLCIQQLCAEKFFKLEYDQKLFFLHVCNLFEID